MPEAKNIAYFTVVLVTFKFQQLVRSWYSVQVTFVCTALWKIYLRGNLPSLFKIRRDLRKLWRNTFWCVFNAPQCSLHNNSSCGVLSYNVCFLFVFYSIAIFRLLLLMFMYVRLICALIKITYLLTYLLTYATLTGEDLSHYLNNIFTVRITSKSFP